MKLLFFVVAYLLLGGCSIGPQKSEIELITEPTAKVYINERESGETSSKNFKIGDLKPGDIVLRLVPVDGSIEPWTKKLKLNNLTTTIVNRKFANEEKYSSGYIMYPEKIGNNEEAAIIVNSKPADASVKLDGQIIGRTPTKIEKVAEGDRHLVISYPGYESQNLFVKTKKGYQVVIDVQLAATKVETPIIEEEDQQQEETSVSQVKLVKIKETGTGWLRVRETASTTGKEISKVDVGKTYKLLETENNLWYKIEIDKTTSGWISAEYAEIIEE